MKRISIIILAIVAVLAFHACEEDEVGPVIEMESAMTLNSLQEGDFVPVLADSIADSTFATFNWQPPEYNVNVTKTYVLQADTAGNEFADAANIVQVGDTNSASVSVFTFNKVLTSDLGMSPDVEVAVEVRAASVLGEGTGPRYDYSDAISLNVTTYEPPFEPEKLYVHGADGVIGYLLPKTGPDTPEGQYEGYIYIPAGGAEIHFGDQAKETMLGSDDPTEPDDNVDLDGALAKDAAAIPVDSGYYQVTVNTYDNSFDMFVTHWGVIGSAIPPYDWSEDVDMTYNVAEDIWTVIVEDVEAAEFKFRPNDTWNPLNYGDDEGDGIPEEYGANIPIGAGTKKITLDLGEYPYSYTVEDAK